MQVLTTYFEGTTPFHSMAAAITHTDGLAFPAENQRADCWRGGV